MPTTTLTIQQASDIAFIQRGGKIPPTYDVTYDGPHDGEAYIGRATFTSFTDTDYSAQVSVMRFDTASLGAGNVASANLILNFAPASLVNENGFALYAEAYPGWNGVMAEADWSAFNSGDVLNGMLPFPLGALQAGVDIVIPVDPSKINIAGYTTFRLHVGDVWGAPATTLEDRYRSEPWNSADGPRLEVTYTAAPVAAPTAQCPLVGTNAVCAVTVNFSDPLIEDYVNGTMYVSLSHPCAIRTTTAPVLGVVGTQRVPVNLGPSASAVLNLLPSASLCPVDGFPQSDVYYIFTMPDGKELRGSVPDAPSAAFQSLVWRTV